MAPTSQFPGFRDHAFAWALVLSFVLHIFAVATLPNIQSEKPASPKILEVVLVAPEKPQPAPIEAPEPAPPEPPKPQIKPKPEPKQIHKPSPITEPPQSPQPAPPAEPAPPAVITAPPKAETPPVFTEPPPPPEPPSPNEQDLDAARKLYAGLLTNVLAKYKEYPNIARTRGWQGEAKIELSLDEGGNLLSSKIVQSSGYGILDKQALEMAKKASPFPMPPEALRGRSFNVLVTIPFILK